MWDLNKATERAFEKHLADKRRAVAAALVNLIGAVVGLAVLYWLVMLWTK